VRREPPAEVEVEPLQAARRGRPSRVTALPYTFVLLNLAAASGLLAFVRGTETAAWKASR